MEIRLRPELENLIQQDVERNLYQAVDEFVERAVSILHEPEVRLAQNHSEIAHKIAEVYAAERGERFVSGYAFRHAAKRRLVDAFRR